MVDNLIRLFDSEDVDFTTVGIGVLRDAESCLVTEERNGEFELEMVYPINGRHYSDLALRKIIVAKSNPYSKPQPFRIYSISKPLKGRVTVEAEHISYDLSGYPVSPFTATGTFDVFTNMKEACVTECPFSFWTNKAVTKDFSINKPASIRSLLGGSEGSVLDVFGTGEYEFDVYDVKLWLNRGENKGVSIRYGKNLTDVKQEENCSSVYTGVYPYYYSDVDEVLVTLPEKIINLDGTYDFVRILTLDLSEKFAEEPTEDELRSAAKNYIASNDIGIPTVSIDVSFEQLSKTSDYKDFEALEDIRLCDTVNVEFPKLGVSATAKCITTVYDVLADKYDKIELGSAKSNLANTLSNQSKAISESSSKAYVDKTVDFVSKAITGNSGGYVVIHSSTGGKYPDEILIMDTDDINTATNVWRWNMTGLGFSPSGYANGRYGVAITQDGQIVADFITAGTLKAIEIEACEFRSEPVEIEGQEEKQSLFSVSKDGTLIAKAGEIGGCIIQNGVLQIKNANIAEKLTVEEIDVTDLRINGNFILAGNTIGSIADLDDESSDSIDEDDDEFGFLVGEDGLLSAKNALISGTIRASKGQIAGLLMQKNIETDGDKTKIYKVLKTNDGNFEIRVSDAGSTIKITELQSNSGVFSENVDIANTLTVSKRLNIGKLSFNDSSLHYDGNQIILFNYVPSASNITATLSNNATSTRVSISLSKPISATKTFQIKVHYTWGDWASKSITIEAGESSGSAVFGDAFWGFDDAYFVSSGSKTHTFTEAQRAYIDFRRHIEPYSTNAYDLGSDNYRWRQLYVYSESISTSDKTEKTDIVELQDIYGELFDRLKPVSYRFKNNTSGRVHVGFIAQDIKEALDELNIQSKDFAAYCEWKKEDGTIGCGLRYGEFVALNTREIQKLKKRIEIIEKELKEKK